MYIPFAERGVGSFDEYLSKDGGGDAIGTLVYTLLDDKNNVHQISFTELISGQFRNISDQFLGLKILFDYVSVTTTIEIKMVNNELIFNTTQVTTYGTTVFSYNDFLDCKECSSKTITRSNSGLSQSDIANRAANFIGNNLKVNPEYNLFNQSNDITSGNGFILGLLEHKYSPFKSSLGLYLEGGNFLLSKIKQYNDYSGSKATFHVNKDLSTPFLNSEINLKF